MGIGMNLFSLATGISKGDLVKHALRFVGMPEGVAAGIGAISDLRSGNFVGAFQNGREAIEALTGGKAGSAHSVDRPSGIFSTIAKAVGFTALGGAAASLLGGGLQGTALGGLSKMMLGALGVMAAFKLGGAALGGLQGGVHGLGFQAEGKFREMFGMTRTQGGPGAAVARLPANATFEDLVSAFMIDAVKDMQEQAKRKMDEIRQSTQDGKGGGGFLKGLLGGAASIGGGLLGGLVGGPIGGMIGGNLGSAAGGLLGGNASKGDDSRNLMFEELKNIMQKLAQMQQAMSNVLNTMHEQAMGAIRHIKA